jgi:hypothetical protein
MLQGCPSWEVSNVYNNTGSDLVIRLKVGIEQWPTGKLLRIDKGMQEQMYWDTQGEMFVPILKVLKGKNELTYSLAAEGRSIPAAFSQDIPGSWFSSGTREFYFQLEKDENIYLVMKSDNFPVEKIPEQPKGFPINPDN